MSCVVMVVSSKQVRCHDFDSSVREIQTNVSHWLKSNQVPSVSIALIHDKKVKWSGAFGEKALTKSATPETLYNIASLAKPITAELFLGFAQDNLMHLDEPLWVHWSDPEINYDDRQKWLTPRLCLSHQTGFPNWRYEQPDGKLQIKWNPGMQFGYSGEGYRYAAKAAENKLNVSFDKLASERLFKPLGLKRISYIYHSEFGDDVARPFGPDGTYGSLPKHTAWNAAGDVLSTASDYAQFMITVMENKGLEHQFSARRYVIDHPGEQNICDTTYQACPIEAESGYALGWGVLKYQNETIIMHRGGDWGVRSLAYFIPETGFGLVVLTNGTNGEAVIRDVVSVFHTNDHWFDNLHQ